MLCFHSYIWRLAVPLSRHKVAQIFWNTCQPTRVRIQRSQQGRCSILYALFDEYQVKINQWKIKKNKLGAYYNHNITNSADDLCSATSDFKFSLKRWGFGILKLYSQMYSGVHEHDSLVKECYDFSWEVITQQSLHWHIASWLITQVTWCFWYACCKFWDPIETSECKLIEGHCDKIESLISWVQW